ncbi:hypothetical protein [Hyalangium versicolor]|uniref:hypothetical protein n=1 Tax=Hyalangium versicolor TaxID=2861190 RepID=UPI001CCCEC9F|nr:hypothetical protein [Hyalangium versicolor]
MTSEFEEQGIDWQGKGYFGCPEPVAGVAPDELSADPWLRWAAIQAAARKGDFAPTAHLVRIYDEAPSPILEGLCGTLLGDAAPSSIINDVALMLDATDSFEATLDFSDVVQSRGLLADVPLLLRAYKQVAEFEDAAILPIHLSWLLEPKPGPLSRPDSFASLKEYLDAVTRRYHERTEKFGTDRVLLLRGERFGVVRLAERLLLELRGQQFPFTLRRKFEASTGIDCSAFYRDRVIQPGDAAKIVERFLESHESERYQDGARYFFGHAVPE